MKSPPIYYRVRNEIPDPVVKVAENRMRNFVRMFGYVMACGAAMDLQRFAVSCYLQGCEDMARAAVKEIEAMP
jgi:hypothetical protein